MNNINNVIAGKMEKMYYEEINDLVIGYKLLAEYIDMNQDMHRLLNVQRDLATEHSWTNKFDARFWWQRAHRWLK